VHDLTNARFEWQMPQAALTRARRPRTPRCANSTKKTNVRTVAPLGEIEPWLSYDLPLESTTRWKANCRPDAKWFAMRFTGLDSEIDIANLRAAPSARI